MTPSHGRSFVSSNHGTQPIQMEERAALAASVAQMVVEAALRAPLKARLTHQGVDGFAWDLRSALQRDPV